VEVVDLVGELRALRRAVEKLVEELRNLRMSKLPFY